MLTKHNDNMNSNKIIQRKSSLSINASKLESKKRRRQKNQPLHRNQCRFCSIVLAITFLVLFVFVSKLNDNKSNLRSIGNANDCQALSQLSPERISKLNKLSLNGCNISSLPDTIKYAKNLKQLDLSNNPSLTSLPDALLNCRQLQILFISSCPGIKRLPTVLGKMTSITRLGWRSGSLTSIDYDGLPPNIIHLILTDNKIKSIQDPRLFERLKHVRKLMLSHNEIEKFGNGQGSIKNLSNLELLRIAGNKLAFIPDELWDLPKLTWLTISGNPITEKMNIESKVPMISMQDLTSTGKFLGQGASGKVSSYIWQNQNVALKIIHGVTSDGRAEDELKIYGAVGSDGIEYRVVGCVALLDGDKKGAVMQQLPGKLEDLALPPTIIEVTKDRWDNWGSQTTFNSSFVMNALSNVARALRFLHVDIGVAHGDVYAHNMKVNKETGELFLLDFGASFFTGEYQKKAEHLEVRAFGVLIEELVSKLNPAEVELSNHLNRLKFKCMDEVVQNRISFDEIGDELLLITENVVS